ncbi:MAG: C1A family cysteine protease [Alteromonadaceae bacterium]|jgi:C1A family cysteine protease
MEALHKRTLQPDTDDHRDHHFCDIHGHKSVHFTTDKSIDISPHEKNEKAQQKIKQQLPKQVDLREKLTSEIINQGLLNSCSACAISVAAELYLIKDSQPFIDENASNIDASQMFIYYNERVSEDKVDLNAPVFIKNGIKSLFKNGICSEKSWPYPESALPKSIKEVVRTGTAEQISAALQKVLTDHEVEIHAAITETPSHAAITQAKKHIINRYCKLSIENGLDEVKFALAKGMPFIFGIMVPKSFYLTPNTGLMTMPNDDELRLGGHALLAVGYDDEKQAFIIRNSWGEEFGDKGYCYMPYEFFSGSYLSGDSKEDNTFSYWCLTHD